ncbi:hypothetical protein ES332_D12G268600v1 [Gossypium tomentosum]|uniref:Uncharacterized protein n=1 Tax=Gossypium tomentosum TaxID=34277 RepID=A0A5D2IFL8_GOSTO|nr:hypothetical protein ES332_D12G268600v1 [Gossypium tomentosum]
MKHRILRLKPYAGIKIDSPSAFLNKESSGTAYLRQKPSAACSKQQISYRLSKREVPEPQARSLLALDKDFQQISETTKQGLVIQHIKEFKHLPSVHAHRGTSTK